MKRWSLQKSAPLSVQQFVDKCFGDDLEFVMRFHNVSQAKTAVTSLARLHCAPVTLAAMLSLQIRGDTDLEVGAWSPAPAAAGEPGNCAKPNGTRRWSLCC